MKYTELSQDLKKQISTLKWFGVSKKGNVTFIGKLVTLERIKTILKWNEGEGKGVLNKNAPMGIRIEAPTTIVIERRRGDSP